MPAANLFQTWATDTGATMNKKKSFLIHIDSLDILDDLTDEQCGQLFKAIKAFQFNEELPLSAIVKIAFSPFKNQFKRDNEKYQKTCEARVLAGSKGGKQKVANASKSKQKLANLADKKNKNKNKTNNKSDSDTNNEKEFQLVWEMYGKKGNRKTSLERFGRMKDSDKKLMAEHLPKYVESTPNKQYRKGLEVYINQECWNDEIISSFSEVQQFSETTKQNIKNAEAFINE